MRRAVVETVYRTFCDVCGEDLTHKIVITQGGLDFCSGHSPVMFKDIVKECAIDDIKRQPFFNGKGRK